MAALTQIIDALRPATSVLVITGAGLSADSGMPTYRGVGGLYDGNTTDDGVPIEIALSGPMFDVRPDLTWKYLLQIAAACRGRQPNRGHEVIAAFESRFERAWTLTQNVDGFHRAAGTRNMIDIHGDLRDLMCTACPWRVRLGDDLESAPFGFPPSCPDCGAVARPDVVLFDEALPVAKLDRLREECDRGFDVVLSVGTSSLFPYIVEPVLMNLRAGKAAFEINPGRTDLSDFVTAQLDMGAAEALDAIWQGLAC